MSLDAHLLIYVAVSALLTLGFMKTVIAAIEQRITLRSAAYRVGITLALGALLLMGVLKNAGVTNHVAGLRNDMAWEAEQADAAPLPARQDTPDRPEFSQHMQDLSEQGNSQIDQLRSHIKGNATP